MNDDKSESHSFFPLFITVLIKRITKTFQLEHMDKLVFTQNKT